MTSHLWMLLLDLLRALTPFITQDGERRFSKETLGALLKAILGLGAGLGVLVTDAALIAPQLTEIAYTIAGLFVGAVLLADGVVAASVRQRLADDANGGRTS